MAFPSTRRRVRITNIANLNQLFSSIAAANTGVSYVDAGQAVMANGAFAWTLPCLPAEPCTGPMNTNVVRAPDGVHFCPTGQDDDSGDISPCATCTHRVPSGLPLAMLGPALDS